MSGSPEVLPSETILLVEDEPAVRVLFAQALRQVGYTVIEARNGAEALQIVDALDRSPDLLLTDIRMPFIGGPELAARLRARRPGCRLLYVSGYASNVEIGADAALLQKPFARADLLRAVRGVLDRPSPAGEPLAPAVGQERGDSAASRKL